MSGVSETSRGLKDILGRSTTTAHLVLAEFPECERRGHHDPVPISARPGARTHA
jgi:hypothetical protein